VQSGKRLWAAAWVVAAAGAIALAGEQADQAREFMRLSAEVHREFRAKNYEKAAALCRTMLGIAPRHPNPHYNLACALARLGKKEEALAALERSVACGFYPADHMEQDEDLATLRADPRFKQCTEKAKQNEARAGGTYEAGPAIPGVRTHEGAPEGGLRYRLRMSPTATAEKPNRLIVWLHPAGGSANRGVEPMARRFVKLGFALLLPTQKDWRSWSGADLKNLLEVTLPAVGKIPGIDATRPILMGYSAGGQAALQAWQANPGKFGGLILDAAYPVRPKPGGYAVVPVPDDPAVKQSPFFVLVGAADGGSRIWKQAEPAWRKAGVPLTLRIIPGKGHTWLFGSEQLDEIAKWLGEIQSGKLPSDAAPEEPKEPGKQGRSGIEPIGQAQPGMPGYILTQGLVWRSSPMVEGSPWPG
jgi:hypothetical protein